MMSSLNSARTRQCLPHEGTYFRGSYHSRTDDDVGHEYFHLNVLENPAFEA